MRSLEKQVIQSYKQKLHQYEEVFTRAIHQQYPIRDEVQRQLQRLRQNLGLGEEVIKSIEAQVTQIYEQKLQQYHEVFSRAIQRQYPLGNDERFLEDFRQVVNLSQKQVNQANEQRLQQYEVAFTQVIHHQYPVSDESRRLLNQLQQNLELSDTEVKSIEAEITQTYEQELQQYQEIFTKAIQRQYPLSDNDDRFLANLRHSFKLNPKITDSIETLENLRRVLNLNEAITDSIEARAIETYTSNLSLPVNTSHKGKNQQKVRRQLLVNVVAVAVALTSVSLLARAAYVQWWQANQAVKVVLEVAETLKTEKKYEACTNQAREIPQQSRFYLEAQTLLNQCQRLAQDEQWLVQAKAFAAQNNFKDAIAQANKIQLDGELHQEAQQLIGQWSKPLQARAQLKQSSSSSQSTSGLKKESETVAANQARVSRQEIPSAPYQQNTTKVTTATADKPAITRNTQDETTKGSDSRQSSIQRSYTHRSSAQQSTTHRSTTQQPSSAKPAYARRSSSQQSATRRSATRQSTTQQSTSKRSGSGGWVVDQE